MTSPDIPTMLETALDELDIAHHTMSIALSDAHTSGLPPFFTVPIRMALDYTLDASRKLNAAIRNLKLAYPHAPP